MSWNDTWRSATPLTRITNTDNHEYEIGLYQGGETLLGSRKFSSRAGIGDVCEEVASAHEKEADLSVRLGAAEIGLSSMGCLIDVNLWKCSADIVLNMMSLADEYPALNELFAQSLREILCEDLLAERLRPSRTINHDESYRKDFDGWHFRIDCESEPLLMLSYTYDERATLRRLVMDLEKIDQAVLDYVFYVFTRSAPCCQASNGPRETGE